MRSIAPATDVQYKGFSMCPDEPTVPSAEDEAIHNMQAELTQEEIGRLLQPLNQTERDALCERMGWTQTV